MVHPCQRESMLASSYSEMRQKCSASEAEAEVEANGQAIKHWLHCIEMSEAVCLMLMWWGFRFRLRPGRMNSEDALAGILQGHGMVIYVFMSIGNRSNWFRVRSWFQFTRLRLPHWEKATKFVCCFCWPSMGSVYLSFFSVVTSRLCHDIHIFFCRFAVFGE